MPSGSTTKTPLKIFFASGSRAQSVPSEARSWSNNLQCVVKGGSLCDMVAVFAPRGMGRSAHQSPGKPGEEHTLHYPFDKLTSGDVLI